MIRAGRNGNGRPKPAGTEASSGTPASSSGPASSGPASSGTASSGTATTSVATAGPATAGPATAGPATAGPATADPATTDPATATSPATATTSPATATTRLRRGAWARIRRATGKRWFPHFGLLLIYELLGVAATWPRFTYLADGKLPSTQDVSGFVWNLWWTAHQLAHLGNPFVTTHMAAPVGTQLAFSTLMPLAGWLMAPITLWYGPSATFTVLTIITPGLLCYVMYRAARLWLNVPGALVAGAFFGLASMLLWQNWYHVNIAMGTIFLPITLEAAVRLRRSSGTRPAVALGLALGTSILISQESTAVAVILAAVILIPWLAGMLITDRAAIRPILRPLGIGALIALVVASPQLLAMLQQILAGGAHPPPGELSLNYTTFGATLPSLFAPSPRLASYGLAGLASAYSFNQPLEALPSYGAVLSGIALLGVAAGWRRRSTWWFLALWLGCTVLALGTSLTFGANCNVSSAHPGTEWGRSCRQYLPLLTHLHWVLVRPQHGPPFWSPIAVSNLMPYTWLVRIPLLSGLREADRFALVGLIGAAMLAGLAVQWLSRRTATRPLIAVVVALGVLEAGWSGAGGPGDVGTMRTTMPQLDQILTKDRSASIVVDVPYGLRGGVPLVGAPIPPQALLIATHDQHPRAISYTAWVSGATKIAVERHPFYAQLINVEDGTPYTSLSRSQRQAARADLRKMHVGWVLEWRDFWTSHHPGQRYHNVDQYLQSVGLRRTHTVCIQASSSGCSTLDQVWLYQPEQRSGP